jgi:YVTN family beta-propeller protein
MARGRNLGRWLVATLALGSPAAHAGEGALVVVNKADASVSIIDTSGAELATIATGEGPHEVAVSPDRAIAVVTNYGTRARPGNSLSVIDLARARLANVVDLGDYHTPHGIAFLDAGRVVVTAEAERRLLVVDLEAGRVIEAIDTGARTSHMVVVDRERMRAYVANIGSGSVSVIDLAAGELIAEIATGAGTEGIDLAPSGAELWVSNRAADTLSIVDTRALEVVATVPCPGFPIRVKFTPDGTRVLVSNARSGDLAVFDATTRREIARIPMALAAADDAGERVLGRAFGDSPVPVGIAVTPDGRHAYVANTYADAIAVVDLDRLAVTRHLAAGREPDGLAYLPRR